MALTIRIERFDDIPVVHLDGELDIYTASSFTELADESLARAQGVAVVLTRVDLIDSSGLGALLRLARPGGETRCVALVTDKAWVGRLLELAHVTDHFLVVVDVPTAVRRLQELEPLQLD